MKKVYFIVITALCMLVLAACAKEDPMDKIAQAVEEGETAVVSTPYADLKVPEVLREAKTGYSLVRTGRRLFILRLMRSMKRSTQRMNTVHCA